MLVHHAGMDTQPAHEGGFDPADYVWPAMIAALLDEDWQVEVDEQRPRIVPEGGAGPTMWTTWCCARRLR